MLRYITKRFFQSCLTILLVVAVVFLLLRLMPTDYYFTEETDGLAQDWGGHTVFCNPPYGSKETGEWTRKCWEEAQKPGTTVVLLIPARTDRKSFHEYIYKKNGVTIDFLPGRLAFELNGEPILNSNGKPQPAPFPSMLVEFNMNPVCSQEQQR